MERIFLGNDKPLLHITADYLIHRFYKQGQLDLRNVLLVFQEQRAINRLEEILAEKAEQIDPAWYPPELLTVGTLLERLYDLKRPTADELTQCFAWIAAIDQLDDGNPDLLHRLIPTPPNRNDLDARLALGRMFTKLHRELAADTLNFIYVADLCRKLKIESESERWEALGKLQEKYHAKLDAFGIWDVQSARLYAIAHPEEFASKQSQFQKNGTEIILVGLVDMNLVQKEMLRYFRNFVTPLVLAPKNWSNRFDDFGCLISHVWQNIHIELNDQQIHMVESASDQAEEVLRCLANLKGKYAPPEIIVGIPDKQVVPFIERQLEQANIEFRIVAGTSIRQTAVYRFLETLLPFLETPTFTHFAALVRHPNMESFLQKSLPKPVNLISALDRYYMEYLPVGLEMVERSDTLNTVFQQLKTLLDSQDFYAILRAVFLERNRDDAYYHILDTLSAIQEIEPELLPNPFHFVDTVRLVLIQVGSTTIPMPHKPKALELVGWLDLAMDDAEVVIVTGMNDGIVPTFHTSDMFLPDTMRRQLSIEDNSRRFARDAYALSCLLTTRHYDPQRVQLIGARRSIEGDPMLPSRLFFAEEYKTVTKRVQHFFTEHREPLLQVNLPRQKKEADITFDLPQIPTNAGQEIKEMNVTEFAEYKKCPYRYYLKCRLKLQIMNDAEGELNAMTFGILLHNVLESFGKTKELKDSTSSEQIQDFLLSEFHKSMRLQYGGYPRSVITIQAERAVKRLEAFADWQAHWAADHEILETELQFKGDRFSLDVDGNVMFLRGRIDRIDRNRTTNELFIWDYKTGNFDDPNKKHRNKDEWIDFQLPLYYHLLSQHGEYSNRLRHGFNLGYIVLPSDTAKTGHKPADWNLPMLLSAIDEAREIVRRIWNNEFEKTDPPPKYSEAFATICNDF